MEIKLIQATPEPIKKIADIASICYGKEDAREPKKLVKRLLRLGHHSVFEHIYFTWEIKGISRACLAQLTRHRHASFTVRSQRYCNESEQGFVIPDAIEDNDTAYIDWLDAQAEIKGAYNSLISKGVKREDARFILPQATETDLYMSCNLRELLHIYKLRSSKAAQWEIRELAGRLRVSVGEELQFMFDA